MRFKNFQKRLLICVILFSVLQTRESYVDLFKGCLEDNYNKCNSFEDEPLQLSKSDLEEFATLVEYEVFTASKVLATYRNLAAKKVCIFHKNDFSLIFWNFIMLSIFYTSLH